MKKIIIIFSFILSLSITYAQDTSIVNYYPMQVGNVWKYSFSYYDQCGQDCYENVKMKIAASVQLYGKSYFIIQTTVDSVNRTQGGMCMNPGTDTMRIDSITGNVLQYSNTGNCYLPHDIVLDSLRSRLHDTLRRCDNFVEACLDTSIVSIFGSSRPSKSFSMIQLEGVWNKGYVKDIGYKSDSKIGMCNGQYLWEWWSSLSLIGCVINGVVYGDTAFPVGINKISSQVPIAFALFQNYPNPFNPTTRIKFSLPNPSEGGAMNVTLKIYDVLGKEVASLIPPLWGGEEGLHPGTYEVEWDASNYSSGVYFYKLEAGSFSQTKKLVLIK